MKLLICTNGRPASREAVGYGIWLAAQLGAEVLLLGVLERERRRATLERVLEESAESLRAQSTRFTLEVAQGRAERVIPAAAACEKCITIVGRLQRPPWVRRTRGPSVRRLLVAIESPVIFVPAAREQLKHALLCMGGLGMAHNMIQRAREIAVRCGTQLTLLHVVEPTTYHYPVTEALRVNQELLETDTPQARNLRQALDVLRSAGLEANVKVRTGFIHREIMREVHSGMYDLIGLGSHYSGAGLRPQFTPNITNEVAEHAPCPALIVR